MVELNTNPLVHPQQHSAAKCLNARNPDACRISVRYGAARLLGVSKLLFGGSELLFGTRKLLFTTEELLFEDEAPARYPITLLAP